MDLEVALGKSLDQLATDKRRNNHGSTRGGGGRFQASARGSGARGGYAGVGGRGRTGGAFRFGRGAASGGALQRGATSGRGGGFRLGRRGGGAGNHMRRSVRGVYAAPSELRSRGVTRLRRSNEERVQIHARNRRTNTVAQARMGGGGNGRGGRGGGGGRGRGRRGGGGSHGGAARVGNSSWGKIPGL